MPLKRVLYLVGARLLPASWWLRTYPSFQSSIRGRPHQLASARPVGGGSYTLTFTDGSRLAIASPERVNRYLAPGGLSTLLDSQYDKYIGEGTISDVDFIIDVGANVGEFTLAALRRWPKARVVCFEPDPRAYHALTLNVADLSNVLALPIALGNCNGQVTFHSSWRDADSSIIKPVVRSRALTVPIRRLDDALSDLRLEGSGLLKMDAEGAEPEVLSGASDFLRRVDLVTVDAGAERAGAPTADEVADLLEGAGLSVRRRGDRGWLVQGHRGTGQERLP
jgi:FkbM family methyltransferase